MTAVEVSPFPPSHKREGKEMAATGRNPSIPVAPVGAPKGPPAIKPAAPLLQFQFIVTAFISKGIDIKGESHA